MGLTARDVMDTRFFTLRPEISVGDAVHIFKRASQELQQTVFGLMVVDANENLVGMVSMYDIFLLLRPKHIHIWGEMEDLEVAGVLETACQRAKGVLVGDIMTTELITITPDTHLLHIIDIMIKKHVRRLPVMNNGKILGIVYLSRVFNHLLERLAS
ncbi:MAG: CBS domain-containing protein [Deltaproteobacteria bacterium]|nr:CBS domain-containing protein [Deltaproteobacteria bacterium]